MLKNILCAAAITFVVATNAHANLPGATQPEQLSGLVADQAAQTGIKPDTAIHEGFVSVPGSPADDCFTGGRSDDYAARIFH
jgi:hypothetical protein